MANKGRWKKNLHEDLKIGLSLQQPSYQGVDGISQVILAAGFGEADIVIPRIPQNPVAEYIFATMIVVAV